MNPVRTVLALIGFFILASSAGADTLILKNGDHLTGSIVSSDGKDLTFKTDFAGEIKVQWAAIKEVSSDKPLYVITPEKKTVDGTVTTADSALVVHTSSSGAVSVPLESVTVIRSQSEQAAYEKSLHPGILESWKGGASIGLGLARGNSETTNLTTGFAAQRKTLNDQITLYFSSLYSSNGEPGGGVTANSILGGGRYDRNLTKRLFAFGAADYTHDELQDLNLRQIYSGGLGVHVIDTPTTTLDVLGGLNYTRETYNGVTTEGEGPVAVNRNLLGVTVGEDFMHKFGKSTVFSEHFYFYPDLTNTGQYRFAADAASVTRINKWLGLQLTFSDRYVSNPPIIGTKPNDMIFSTGITVAFSH